MRLRRQRVMRRATLNKTRRQQRSTPVYENGDCRQQVQLLCAQRTLLLLSPVAEMLENVKLPVLDVDPEPVLPDTVL